MKKSYLSLDGLTIYNEEIKSYINAKVKTNTDAIGVLNGTGEGSVSKTVADAIATAVVEHEAIDEASIRALFA